MTRLIATPAEIQTYLALLNETPPRLAVCIVGQTELPLSTSSDKDIWSAVEVLAHLRACADVWTHSVYAMLVYPTPRLPLLHPRRWAKATRYSTLEFRPSLQAFTLGRGELMRVLSDLAPEAWARTAMIENRPHSVFSQIRRMALHEVEHCQQLEALLR